MANRTVEAIDREIAECKEELANVKGRETEVYTRIVGYYRAVKNWNKGIKSMWRSLRSSTPDMWWTLQKALRKHGSTMYSQFLL